MSIWLLRQPLHAPLADIPSVRQDETLYILRQLATIKLPNSDRELRILDLMSIIAHPAGSNNRGAYTSSRSHLIQFYPLLLDISFLEHGVPSTWISPSEYDSFFVDSPKETVNSQSSSWSVDDFVEITARDLARRCLELIGREQGLGGVHP